MAEREKSRNTAVDFLKGISILFIIILHFEWEDGDSLRFLFPLWANMAVPVFMILSGFVYALSYQRKGIERIRDAYKAGYILEKLIRYLVPYTIVYFVEVLYRIFVKKHTYVTAKEWFGMYVTGGIGPGSYYVPIMVELIFAFPLLFFLIKKFDFKGLIGSFAFCFAFEVLQFLLGMDPYLYRFLIFRYVFAVSAGCYMAIGKHGLKPLVTVICALIGGGWIVAVSYFGYALKVVMPVWASTGFIATLWVVPFVYYLVRRNIHFVPLEFIGRASYNIFLVQLAVYGYGAWFIYTRIPGKWLQLLTLMLLILAAGIAFYLIESRLTGKIIGLIRKKNKK